MNCFLKVNNHGLTYDGLVFSIIRIVATWKKEYKFGKPIALKKPSHSNENASDSGAPKTPSGPATEKLHDRKSDAFSRDSSHS
jgi:hypothetical protein